MGGLSLAPSRIRMFGRQDDCGFDEANERRLHVARSGFAWPRRVRTAVGGGKTTRRCCFLAFAPAPGR
jgi:hypothetical protein